MLADMCTFSVLLTLYGPIGHSNYCHIGKTKRRLKAWQENETFNALTNNSHSSATADNMTRTGLRDHFDILATGQSDIHCKIKETLLIRDLKPALNEKVGSKKLLLFYPFIFHSADLTKSVYFFIVPSWGETTFIRLLQKMHNKQPERQRKPKY